MAAEAVMVEWGDQERREVPAETAPTWCTPDSVISLTSCSIQRSTTKGALEAAEEGADAEAPEETAAREDQTRSIAKGEPPEMLESMALKAPLVKRALTEAKASQTLRH